MVVVKCCVHKREQRKNRTRTTRRSGRTPLDAEYAKLDIVSLSFCVIRWNLQETFFVTELYRILSVIPHFNFFSISNLQLPVKIIQHLAYRLWLQSYYWIRTFIPYNSFSMQRALTSRTRASVLSSSSASKLRPLTAAGFNAQQLRFAHKVR